MTDDRKKQNDPMQFGTSTAVAFGLFAYLGHKADEKYGTEYIWTLVGLGLAMVWTAYEIWKIVRSTNDD